MVFPRKSANFVVCNLNQNTYILTKMKKKILFIAMMLWLGVACVLAQKPSPVKWTFSHTVTGKNGGIITATATIEKGWHMYGLELPKGGPKPTEWTFSKISGVEFTGQISTKPLPLKVNDSTWQMELSWWDGTVTFSRSYKIKDRRNAVVECQIKYMVCSGETCMPPTTVTHTYDLK